jgi:flagellar operon protein
MIDSLRINSSSPILPAQSKSVQTTSGNGQSIDFAQTLAEAQNLKFSNHAQKRLQTRNISLTDEGLSRLNNAVNKAEKKGGQESLVLMDDLAFIVNIKDRLVVTAMDTNNRGEGVFTKIDSVVFAEPAETKSAPEDGSGSTL